MKNRLSHKDFEELAIENHYPNGFFGDSSLMERQHAGKFFFGEGWYQEIYFNGIHIGFGNLALKNTMQLDIECDYQTVEMKFELTGKSISQEPGRQVYSELLPNQHNIFYVNGFRGHTLWECKRDMQVLEVNLMPELFLKYLPESGQRFSEFHRKIRRGETALLSPHNFSITPAMLWLIHEIITCSRSGFFKRVFLEAKVIELLLLQLEQICEADAQPQRALKKADVEKMFHVKQIIEQNMNSSYSLADLAKAARTNQFTLKKGFKEIFGTTVFGYWNDLKMAEAKTLLLEQKLSVSEVSVQLGYKNPQHFSTAFKRKFAISPCQLKA
ncbi:transcriptional regulator, AraC family [Chloroherpeton thalassium ATCC 35110]|uniref:Transcriptional regulator, AraC family n=1 Tax=Chloroherpeton thalassium (strain ATCC 35110 / GB-78) TaxID=517418 RepID=B3QXI0_CHLT3|nr:AraC family transcriptional regulator [Chloroherpeton thalassium]ACF13454.1 transcriptional regulator, AraC family [Chloroherpeton thalassium ATCC 35110]